MHVVHVNVCGDVWMKSESCFLIIHLRKYSCFCAVVVQCLVEMVNVERLVHCELTPVSSKCLWVFYLKLQV